VKILDNNINLSHLKSLYDDVELAILFDWLRVKRPISLSGINLEKVSEEANQGDTPIRLIRDLSGQYSNFAVSNAVARLVLSEVQGRLPQWVEVYEDGRALFGRTYTTKRQAKVNLLPRFQFMINWADSGPGYSWPESYFTGYLPGFDLYVVTASQDSPDMHGYTDEAIGYFPADVSISEGVHKVVVDWWQWLANECTQYIWESLFETGEVDAATAKSWALEVWDADTGEPLGNSA
jgi:hypothetical protein